MSICALVSDDLEYVDDVPITLLKAVLPNMPRLEKLHVEVPTPGARGFDFGAENVLRAAVRLNYP